MVDPRTSTVADLLRRSAARYPHRVALRFADVTSGEDRVWTYRDLDVGVSRAATRLRGLGLVKGDRVAACAGNSDAYVIAFLACARTGLVHVPIDVPRVGRADVLERSDAALLLRDPDVERDAQLEASTPRTLVLRGTPDSLLTTVVSGSTVDGCGTDVPVSGGDLAQLLWTAGGGPPRAAMLTHSALVHGYLSAVVDLELAADDVPLHAMPLQHGPQLHSFLLPYLMLGASNRLLEAADPFEVLDRLERERRGSFFAVATTWVALGNEPDFDTRELSALRKAYCGSAAIPGRVLDRLRRSLPLTGFYRCFGQCETGSLATVLRPEQLDTRPGSAGQPVLFVELRVLDRDGRDVAPGEVGELAYRSPQLCSGYWDQPGATAAAFRDGWFRSGDLARMDRDGYLYPVDEIKDVISTGGLPREEYA